MSFQYSFKPPFQKSYEKLTPEKQHLVLKALEAIRHYLSTGEAAFGLRIKKLYDSGLAKTFEARVSLDTRIVWVQSHDKVAFSLLGNHEEVRRFIKNL